MLNIIGAGLRGTESITRQEIEVMNRSDIVYVDRYTSIPPDNFTEDLRNILNVPVKETWRDFVETGTIIEEAGEKNVSLIVAGDSLSATTHNEIRLEAMERGIKVNVFENASIINTVIGKTGLFHYKNGPPVSIPQVSKNFYPLSVIDKIYRNFKNGMHTVMLIDLKDGRNIPFEEVRDTLKGMERERSINIFSTDIIAAIRISFPDEEILYGNIDEISPERVKSPYVLVLPAAMDENEKRFVSKFCTRI